MEVTFQFRQDHLETVLGCPVIEVDISITGQREVRMLDRLRVIHGSPQAPVMDIGPEFTSKAV